MEFAKAHQIKTFLVRWQKGSGLASTVIRQLIFRQGARFLTGWLQLLAFYVSAHVGGVTTRRLAIRSLQRRKIYG